ncbi:MAG: sulfatase/phosphatase domain-containing protein, partial [Dehalococcoidia bacterium]
FGTVNALRYFNRVRVVLEDNLAHIDEIGEAQHNNNYPLGWAMAGNTPLKRYKQNTHGGGVRDPLILHWPAGIQRRGEIRQQFHHVSDITPTILDVLGVAAPEQINGVAQQPVEGVSLRYSFDAPAAPTAKGTQYFEMLGHRGIWKDGWKAVTWHRPGTAFDDDRWELYHVEEDFSECNDLAAELPEKLRQLVDLWWEEAEKYRVLPLNDGLDRWVVQNPHALAARRRWLLYPGSGRIPHATAPDIKNRSYSITAEVEVPEGGAEGVLIAQGDNCGGYALYLKDGHLVHDYNFVGRHHLVRSSVPVPAGRRQLRFRMIKTGEFAGRGALFIDGEAAGEIEIPQTYRAQTSFIGLEVGRAPSPAVSDFVAPFPFTGRLESVLVELDDDQRRDPEAELEAKVGTQ